MGLAFAANFEMISTEKNAKEEHYIGSIGVQILTIDEISLMIIQDENLRNNIISTISKVFDNLVLNDFSEHD